MFMVGERNDLKRRPKGKGRNYFGLTHLPKNARK